LALDGDDATGESAQTAPDLGDVSNLDIGHV